MGHNQTSPRIYRTVPDPSANFFDEARIYVRAGRGGDGAASFRREKHVPLGGPDGGDGGRGGDVLVRARENLHALTNLHYRHHFAAGDGARGEGSLRQGRDGEPFTIEVPLGTVVYDADTSQLVGDLVTAEEIVTVAEGGRGGRGNARFKSSRFQAPNISLRGEDGEERNLRLELELIADVGLVGMPNAGKSSLLSRISAARPKVAPYPFTTLEPVLGVVATGDTSIVIADLPGLIEGASEGAGLGAQFLRHARRSRVLVHVIDGSGLERPPLQALDAINDELVSHGAGLESRPQIVAFNKIDLVESRELWTSFKAACCERGMESVATSSATGKGLSALIDRTLATLATAQDPERPQLAELPILRPEPIHEDPRLFRREDGAYIIRDSNLERLAERLNLESLDAVDYLQRRLDRRGITARLERAGAKPGDTVVIGDLELEWAAEGL